MYFILILTFSFMFSFIFDFRVGNYKFYAIFQDYSISPLSRSLINKIMSGTCSAPKHSYVSPLLSLNLNILTMFMNLTDFISYVHISVNMDRNEARRYAICFSAHSTFIRYLLILIAFNIIILWRVNFVKIFFVDLRHF